MTERGSEQPSPGQSSRKQLILALGTGRCGTHSLAGLLNRQRDAHVTHEEPPVLPWRPLPGRSGIRERLRRVRRTRLHRLIGDVGSFYLPYVEEAIAEEPDVRVSCLGRAREQVVDSFCRWLDAVHPLPTNHWAARPAEGWCHEPVWTRIFPRYDSPTARERVASGDSGGKIEGGLERTPVCDLNVKGAACLRRGRDANHGCLTGRVRTGCLRSVRSLGVVPRASSTRTWISRVGSSRNSTRVARPRSRPGTSFKTWKGLG